MAVTDEVRTFIYDELLPDQEPVPDPLAEGKLDSLALEQVIGFVEARYGVAFEDEELVAENFSSLDALTTLVDAKLAQRPAS